MSGKFTFVLALVTAAAMVAAPSASWAQDDPPPHIPGTVHGTGTYFEITDSDYLNVTVETTEGVSVLLSSYPELVSLHVSGAEGASSTQVTIRGLPPGIVFHRYLDDLRDHTLVDTGEQGTDVFTLDLTTSHHVILKPRPSTITLDSDGWSQPVGTWDPVTRIATLTQDVRETIQISASDITLDGDGHTVAAPKDYGIFVPSKSYERITIQNTMITPCANGIYAEGCRSLIIRGNAITTQGYGVSLSNVRNAIVSDNSVNSLADGHMKMSMELRGVTYSSFRSNTLTGRPDCALYLTSCVNDTLWHNDVKVEGTTLSVYASTGVLFFDNFFTSALGKPPLVSGSSGLRFFLARPVGGNYWNTWASPDNDGDGFVDVEYNFDKCKEFEKCFSGGIDKLPLATPTARALVISASASEGGAIEPSGEITVLMGETITFRFLPQRCKQPDLVWVDGVRHGAKDTYTFVNVVAPHTISVSFSDRDVVPDVAITSPPSGTLVQAGVPVEFAGQFWDDTDQTHTAAWYLDGVALPAGETVVDEALQTVATNHVFTAPGVYALRLVVTDDCGLAGEATQVEGVEAMVVVFDPNAGFVTGVAGSTRRREPSSPIPRSWASSTSASSRSTRTPRPSRPARPRCSSSSPGWTSTARPTSGSSPAAAWRSTPGAAC